MVDVAEVPQRADAPEDAATHHQNVFGAVNQQQLVVIVCVLRLLAGGGDGRRAQPVVNLGPRFGFELHFEVRVQLIEGVDSADVEPARARIGDDVIDEGSDGKLGIPTEGGAEENDFHSDHRERPRPPPLHLVCGEKQEKIKLFGKISGKCYEAFRDQQ